MSAFFVAPAVLAVIGLLVFLARRATRLGWALRRVAVGLLWVVGALVVFVISMGFLDRLRGTSPLGWLAIGVVTLALGIGWRWRRRVAIDDTARVVHIDRWAFVGVYVLYATSAVVWLLLGLVPAMAAAIPSFGDQLREWGNGEGVFADMALEAARAARNASSGVQVTLDYLFSALNLLLATFLVVKVRGNRTANLLALGMVGTAVAFNLQSHAALLVLGTHLGGLTRLWHDLAVHVMAGIAYVFALLLFPDGSVDRTRGPHLLGLALFFGVVSFIAIPDHTSALVLLFGVLVPAAALVAQSRRFRDAQRPELQQLFRLLRGAMGLSLAGALAVLVVTGVLNARDEQFSETTRDYELVAPRAGSYTFFCDPHVADMHGIVVVRDAVDDAEAADAAQVVEIGARGNEFDRNVLELVAGRTTVIRFTNSDGTAHNVSIYEDSEHRKEFWTGQLFSGQDLATFTFRVFRFVFAIIPVALFVAILRFHLWDVQRLVNRAMVYSLLTGGLGLAYALGALLVALVPGRVFNQRELLVVWILAAAVMIRPARRRLQTMIDKRYYREKLDTIRTLEGFAAHVRDEIDLDRLADQLVAVVSETMHPKQVSLWIRDGEGSAAREAAVGGSR